LLTAYLINFALNDFPFQLFQWQAKEQTDPAIEDGKRFKERARYFL